MCEKRNEISAVFQIGMAISILPVLVMFFSYGLSLGDSIEFSSRSVERPQFAYFFIRARMGYEWTILTGLLLMAPAISALRKRRTPLPYCWLAAGCHSAALCSPIFLFGGPGTIGMLWPYVVAGTIVCTGITMLFGCFKVVKIIVCIWMGVFAIWSLVICAVLCGLGHWSFALPPLSGLLALGLLVTRNWFLPRKRMISLLSGGLFLLFGVIFLYEFAKLFLLRPVYSVSVYWMFGIGALGYLGCAGFLAADIVWTFRCPADAELAR